MKRQTARLLRGVIRLIEDDLRECADSVVEIDEREAAHYRDTLERLDACEAWIGTLAQRAGYTLPVLRPTSIHSRKVPS